MRTMLRKQIGTVGALALTLCAARVAYAAPPLEQKPVLSLEAAKGMAAAAEKAAMANGWNMVIAILDDGGNLLLLERMDGAILGSVQIAQDKAHTAAFFKAPSSGMRDGLKGGNLSLLKLNVLPFAGGLPITVDGKQVGAIGVSGGAQDTQDAQVAQTGIDWLKANAK